MASSSWNMRDGGVVVNQSLPDAKRTCRRPPAPDRVASLGQNDADAHLGPREVKLELGDTGVGVGQLLLDRQRLAVGRKCP